MTPGRRSSIPHALQTCLVRELRHHSFGLAGGCNAQPASNESWSCSSAWENSSWFATIGSFPIPFSSCTLSDAYCNPGFKCASATTLSRGGEAKRGIWETPLNRTIRAILLCLRTKYPFPFSHASTQLGWQLASCKLQVQEAWESDAKSNARSPEEEAEGNLHVPKGSEMSQLRAHMVVALEDVFACVVMCCFTIFSIRLSLQFSNFACFPFKICKISVSMSKCTYSVNGTDATDPEVVGSCDTDTVLFPLLKTCRIICTVQRYSISKPTCY